MILTVQSFRSVAAGFLKNSRCLRGATAFVTSILLAVLVCAASGCAWLDAKQRQAIYRPTQGVPADFVGLRAGDERYFLAVPKDLPVPISDSANVSGADQRVEIWWLPHADARAPTLLYFHGTFRNLYENLRKIDSLRAAGFAVLAVDYRGWGRSTPITPSEQSILQDANIAWAELQRREPRPQHRVLYGHSMGSGVAVDLASRLKGGRAGTAGAAGAAGADGGDYGGLILESALSSFGDVAGEVTGFTGFLARLLALSNNERFASIDKISKVTAPLLMIHGNLDTTIAPSLGKKLYEAANAPKQWLVIEGGAHSDVDDVGKVAYQAALLAFKGKYLTGP